MEKFENINEKVRDIAQNPSRHVLSWKEDGEGLSTIISKLNDARKLLTEYLASHTDVGVEHLDEDFEVFRTSNADEIGYFVGLFNILKKADFERYEIQGFTMDQNLLTTPEQIKEYIIVTEKAFNTVFKDEQQ